MTHVPEPMCDALYAQVLNVSAALADCRKGVEMFRRTLLVHTTSTLVHLGVKCVNKSLPWEMDFYAAMRFAAEMLEVLWAEPTTDDLTTLASSLHGATACLRGHDDTAEPLCLPLAYHYWRMRHKILAEVDDGGHNVLDALAAAEEAQRMVFVCGSTVRWTPKPKACSPATHGRTSKTRRSPSRSRAHSYTPPSPTMPPLPAPSPLTYWSPPPPSSADWESILRW